MALPVSVLVKQNRSASFICFLVGALLPFARARDEASRQLSRAECYTDHARYLDRIRVVAREGVANEL